MTNNLEDEDTERIVAAYGQLRKTRTTTQTPARRHTRYLCADCQGAEEEDQTQIVDSSHHPQLPLQHDSFLSAYLFVCFSLFLILATLTFQCYCMINPP